MQLALAAEQLAVPFDFVVRDVDSDAVWARRWGLKIPVLLRGDELICHGRLDIEALRLAIRV
jgi:Glutaredoxin-like domain (DUF836)